MKAYKNKTIQKDVIKKMLNDVRDADWKKVFKGLEKNSSSYLSRLFLKMFLYFQMDLTTA